MTAADLIRLLLELDQQCLTSRPSAWGKAARLVRDLVQAIDDPDSYLARTIHERFGGWRYIDVSVVSAPAPRELSQPTLDAIQEQEALATPAPGWIAVADRLPEPGAEVLAYCKTGIIGERMQRVACHHPTDGWRTKGGLHLTVTHWMTLPEGPRDA